MTEESKTYRIEHDSLGERPVPADVYWGINTQRAIGNFPGFRHHRFAAPQPDPLLRHRQTRLRRSQR